MNVLHGKWYTKKMSQFYAKYDPILGTSLFPVYKCLPSTNVRFDKCQLWQTSALTNVHFNECPLWRMSALTNVRSDECPLQRMSALDECPLRQMSASIIVRLTVKYKKTQATSFNPSLVFVGKTRSLPLIWFWGGRLWSWSLQFEWSHCVLGNGMFFKLSLIIECSAGKASQIMMSLKSLNNKNCFNGSKAFKSI